MIPAMSRDACLEAFRKMLLIRRFEEACIVAAGEGKVPGHFHVYHGQEATGCAPDLNFPLSSGIVGGILPISTGTAYAMKHRKLPNVSVVFFGEGAVVRKGRDVTLVGYSIDLVRCLKAAAELERAGIDAEVIDLRTLAPLDTDTVCESAGKTGRLVVADECYPAASVASEVASISTDKGFGLLKKPAVRLNFPAVPVPLSPPPEQHLLPRVDKIVAAAKQLMG